jgi:hypothetical protein
MVDVLASYYYIKIPEATYKEKFFILVLVFLVQGVETPFTGPLSSKGSIS